MANNNPNRIEKLRQTLVSKGYKGKELEDSSLFYEKMKNPKHRKTIYDAYLSIGFKRDFDDFNSILDNEYKLNDTQVEDTSAPIKEPVEEVSQEQIAESSIAPQEPVIKQPVQTSSMLQDIITPVDRKLAVAESTNVELPTLEPISMPLVDSKDYSSMSIEELQSEIAPLQDEYNKAKSAFGAYKEEITPAFEKEKRKHTMQGSSFAQVRGGAYVPTGETLSIDEYGTRDDDYQRFKQSESDAAIELTSSPAYKEFSSRQVKELEKKKLELEEQAKKLDSDYYNFSRQKKDYGKSDSFVKELDTKRDIIKAQLEFTNKTIQALQAPTKEDNSWWLTNVFRGAGDNLGEMLGTIGDAFTGFSDVRNNIAVADALKKVASLGEKATPEAIDKALTKEEKDMLIQWEQMNEINEVRAHNLSTGYKVGEAVATSAGFMLDFLLTRGLANAASAPAKKAVMNAFGKWLTSNTVKGSKVASNVIRGTGKTAAWTTDATISTAARTPLMSSTYENITKRMTEFDESGKPRSVMDAIILGTTDSLIENFSETSGIMINKLGNAVVYKPLIKKPFYALLGKMGASGKGVKAFGKEIKEFTNILKKGGYDGYTEEMLEEVFGAILTEARGLTGIDPNDKQAWEEFWEPENLMVMAQSIAIPMMPGMVKGTVRGVKEYKKALPVGEGNASAYSAESTTQLPNSNLQAPMPATYDFGDGNVVQGRLIGDYTIEDGKLQGNPIFQHEENDMIVTTKLIDKDFDRVSFEQTPQEQAQEQQDVSTNQDGTLTVGEEITDDDIDAFIDALEADAKEEGIEDVRRGVKAKFTNSDGVTNEGELMGSYSIIDGNIVGNPVFRYTNAGGTTVVRPLSQADLEKLEVEGLQKQEPIAPQEQAVEQTESQAEGQTQGQTTEQPQEVEQEVVAQENIPIQEEQGQAEKQTAPINMESDNPMFDMIRQAESIGVPFASVIDKQEKKLKKLKESLADNFSQENIKKVQEQMAIVEEYKRVYDEYQSANQPSAQVTEQVTEQAPTQVQAAESEPVVISNDDTNTEGQPAIATTDQQTEQVMQEEPTIPVVEEQNKETEQISEEVKRVRATNAVLSALEKAGVKVVRATQDMVDAVLGKSGVEFRFIGEKGAANLDKREEVTIRLDNLAVAREMENAGKDAKTIKLATGWERGADSKWRYEIDDVFTFNSPIEKLLKLRKEYAEIDKEYSIAQSRFYNHGTAPRNSTKEQKDRAKNIRDSFRKITAKHTEIQDKLLEAKRLETTLGEFIGQDNPLFFEYPELKEMTVSFDPDYDSGYLYYNGYKGAFLSDNTGLTAGIWINFRQQDKDLESTFVHELQHAIQHIEGFSVGSNTRYSGSYDSYRKTSGEVEARNVSNRLKLTPEERKNTLAQETEDVSREDQIFINENVTDRIQFLRSADGTIYGWVEDGTIYLTEDGMNPNTPIHEYTHLWAQAVQREYAKKWQQIKDTLKECIELWDEVVNDPAYESIKDNEDAIASELLSRYSGKNGEQRLMDAVSDLKTSSAKSIIDKVKSAIRELWKSVQRLYGIDTTEFYKSNFDDINKIADSVLRDLINGKNPLLVENPNNAKLRIQQYPMQSAIEDTGIAHLDNVESFENTHLPKFASVRNYTEQEAIAMVNTISEKMETLENYISGTLSQYSNLESVAQTIKTINERIKALQESLSFVMKQKGITMSDLSTIASEPNAEYTKTTQQEEPIQEEVKEELVQEVEQTQIEEGEPSTDKVTLGLRLGRFEAAKEDDLQGMSFDKIVRTSNGTFRARFVGTNDNGNDVYQVYNPNTGNKQYKFKYIDNAASVEDLSTGYVNVDNKGKIHKKATEDTNSVRVYFTDNKESEERVFVYFADSVKSSSTSYTSIYNEEGELIKKEKEVQNIWDKTKEEIKKYIKEKVEKSIYSRIEQGFNISNPTYLTAKETLLETQKLYTFSQKLLLQDKDFATTGASQQKAAAFSQTMTELLAEAKKDAASKGIKVAKVIAESAQKELEEMDTPQFLVTEEDIIEGTHEQRKSIRTWLKTIGIKVHMLSQEEFVEKVNSFLDKPEFHITRSQKGDVYGFVYRGQVYINKSIAGSEVYVHEYSHIWLQSLKKLNPQLFERGVELAKLMPEYEELLGNAIANLPSDSKITQEQLELWAAEEMLAYYMGKRGAERINALAEQGDSAIGLAKRIKAWIKEAYNYIKSVMDSFSDKEIAKMREEDFADMMLNDLANLVEIKSASVKEELKSMEAYLKSIDNLKREFLMYIGGVENGGLDTSYIVARNQLRFIIKKISKLYPRGAKITRKQCEDIYRQLLESNKTNFRQGNIKAETYTRPLVKAFNNLEKIFNEIASNQIEVLQAKVDKTFNRSISGTRKQDIKRGGVMSYIYANAVMSLREQSEEELLDGTNTTLTNNKRAELNDKFDKLAEEIKDLQEQLNNATAESKEGIERKIREKQTSYNMLAVEELAITAQEERRKVAEADAQMSEHIKRIDNLREQIKQDRLSRSAIQSEVVANAQQEEDNKYSINTLNKRIKEANEEIRYIEYLMSVTSKEILEHNNKQLIACNAILEAGKSEYHTMVYKRVQEKAEFLAGAINDVQVSPDKQVSKLRDKINNVVQKTLGSLDYLIDRISVNALKGNSFLRKHFLDVYNKRNSEYIKQMQEHWDVLNAKISETFDGVAGDKIKKVENINDLSYLLNEVLFGEKIEYDIPQAKEEEPEHVVLELNMAQAMEIYIQARQEDGRKALNNGGITDEIIERVVSRFDEPSMAAYKEWADYMQLELLPSLKERFNKRYREQFFIDIPSVENYFPIKAKLQTTKDLLNSLSGSDYRFNASTVANNLYARSHNSMIDLREVDINPANVLAKYLCNMEHWYHMSELQEKTNWLVNSGKFQRLLKQQGESTRKHFNQALIYTVSNTDSHSVIGNIVSMYQLGMVGFRGMTAIKQLASIPAFFIYATNKYVATEMALNASPHRLFGRIKRAKELFPTIRERIESGSMGSELLLEYEDSGSLKTRRFKRGFNRVALWANRRVDIYVVANGTLAVYDGLVKQYLSDGYSQAEAEAKAFTNAMNAFEATQQSSNRAYLAPFQQSRNWSLITGFQNASYAYGRRFVEMARFFRDWTNGRYKEQIQNTIKYYVEFEGFSQERAEELANKDFKRSMISSFNTVVGLGLSSFLFKYGITGFVQWLFGYDGDDDEDTQKRILPIYMECILNATGGVFLEGLAYGSVMTDLINQTIKGERIRKVDFAGLLKPFGEGVSGFAEGVQMLSDEDKENSDAWFKIVQSFALAYPSPMDAPTATKIIVGIKDMFTNAPNKDEFWIGFLNFMNLPTSQMANILQAVEGYASNREASKDPRYINAYNWASRLWEYIE